MTVAATNRFVSIGDGFELEHAGRFLRIWHDVCLKHDLLPGDDKPTIDKWKVAHRCGPRTSDWDSGGAW